MYKEADPQRPRGRPNTRHATMLFLLPSFFASAKSANLVANAVTLNSPLFRTLMNTMYCNGNLA
jgi:hypothetical protein